MDFKFVNEIGEKNINEFVVCVCIFMWQRKILEKFKGMKIDI